MHTHAVWLVALQALLALAWLLNLSYLWEEVLEARKGLGDCASQPTNWNDAALILVVLVSPPALLLDADYGRLLAAAGTTMLFFKGAKAMRGNEQLSFLVLMLSAIIQDMGAFLLIQGAAIVSFAFTFALLLKEKEPYDDGALALFSSYSLLMHGDGFGETDLYASSSLAIAAFMLYTLLLNIVMLNALIAIMARRAAAPSPSPVAPFRANFRTHFASSFLGGVAFARVPPPPTLQPGQAAAALPFRCVRGAGRHLRSSERDAH